MQVIAATTAGALLVAAAGCAQQQSPDRGEGDLPRFVHEPATNRSEAVHVSHLGFRPDDPAKVAFCHAGWGRAVLSG